MAEEAVVASVPERIVAVSASACVTVSQHSATPVTAAAIVTTLSTTRAVAAPINLPAGGWTRNVTCRYFIHGVCKEGNNCHYSHDLSTSQSTMICWYYQRGCCAYGNHCRYKHTEALKQELPAVKTLSFSSPDCTSLPDTSCGVTKEANSNLGAVTSCVKDWVNAVEFVPGQPYCGRAAACYLETPVHEPVIEEGECEKQLTCMELKKELCPYAAMGECRYGENCVYLHGDICDMCGLQVLHPVDTAQRSQHIKSCIDAHEKDMELSFAVQRSKDMACGICMEVVYEKANPSERRFGILSNCSHTYCLKCIRKWRRAKQFESKIIKSCPECRITSNFVIPSEYWVEEKEEKQKLIQKYKEAMRTF
ncbi:E3 ubiquitin-protein ligase makorin-1 isoform X2 [Microcaecilia unicolor]|uniref:RING-type E3 ubiquitin transferase n=2 Tax=Microcaecilia unicolor TaxID=1415580 RepID=A0A6P7Z811_9AMPH|nr:E3 ubiquitin-protein ligase makorin-1 isoform X2 [Microcaecilia unicolor]